jgi:two-component system response regulator HydG/two-component system response regulator AtoC
VRKPPVLLLECSDALGAEIEERLRAHGLEVARSHRGVSTGSVVVVVASNESAESTCSRLLRWYSSLDDGVASAHGARGERRLVGGSDAIALVRSAIERVAPCGSNVLVTGETGTGKELIAELIHFQSGRRGPLVPINCAAIPDGLLESELFGYERGAFTGANASYEGKLRLAQGGTVLLDEVGDMSAYAQAKLLRAIETREVMRLGGRRPVPLDVRIVAATNADLDALVAQGRFRADLYFRLNVARIHVPPLRERPQDVPDLLRHSLEERRAQASFSAEALDCLCRYPWPGNVRELRNVVEVMTLAGGAARELNLEDLPPAVRTAAFPPPTRAPVHRSADEERERLLAALRTTHWNKSRAAAQLRWSRMTVYRKMAKYRIGESEGGVTENVDAR